MNKKFLFGVLVLLALSPQAWAQERYRVTYRLSFVMTGGHSPMYLALDKGYFDQAGLSVQIFEGRETGQNMQLMAAGVETFAEADFGQVAKAISEGLPIKAVFGRYQLGPLGVISLADTGIRSPRDLIGKKVGTFPGSSDGLAFPALLKANGVDVNAVKLARKP